MLVQRKSSAMQLRGGWSGGGITMNWDFMSCVGSLNSLKFFVKKWKLVDLCLRMLMSVSGPSIGTYFPLPHHMILTKP